MEHVPAASPAGGVDRMNRSLRKDFEVPDEIAYLNAAGHGPRLRSVGAALQARLVAAAQPWRLSMDDYLEAPERLRRRIAPLFGADAGAIAFVPSAAYGISIAAHNLPIGPGRYVVMPDREYPSNRNAWVVAAASQNGDCRYVRRAPDRNWTQSLCEAIDERSAVVAVPAVHWHDGARMDLAAIAARAHEVGAALVVDASQSLGVLPLDCAALRPDFVVSVGHKWLLGEYGLGYLYASPRWCEQGRPLEQTWVARKGREDVAALGNALPNYRSGAARFDFGGYPAAPGLLAASVALDYRDALPPPAVGERIAAIAGALCERLRRAGLGEAIACAESPHILSIRPPAGAVAEVCRRLAEAGVIVGPRGDALRVSPHLHNSDADLDRLVEVLRRSS